MTHNCVGLTQSSVIQIIHRIVGLKFLLLSLVFAYIYISQGSVENCLQSMSVKEF